MADNINKQDLQDNNEELNRFNDSLKESIDLSRSLSRNVKAVTESLGLGARKNKELFGDLNRYNAALSKTASISQRLVNGRVKEKEVLSAIKNIEQTYAKYIENNNKSFGERGRFTLRQKDLQKDLLKLEDEEIQKRLRISEADTKIDTLRRQLAGQQNRRDTTNSLVTKGLAKDAIKLIQEKIKEEEKSITILERASKDTAKELTKKQQELDKVEEIILAHKNLQREYENEISQGKEILELARKQSLSYSLTKGGVEGLVSGLKDIKNLFSPFSAIFEFIKKIAFSASDQVVRIQKGLVASKEEAYALRQGFNDAAVASGEISVNTERMVAANTELGKQLGFNSRFSNDMNIQFIKLTKQLGISEEAAGGLAKLTKANGLEFKDVKNTVYQTTQALSSQNGIQIDQREVMEEVGKITGQTLAMLKGNPKALTEAVVQAKLLGTTLESAKKSGAALLDFESSIENELQAELITGKQFNLERARSAALTGDLTTEMKELANQGIDFNNYSNMNVIAQQKIADMMGKTTDELTDQLLKQQYLGMSREQIVAMSGEEVANRVEALNAQDKFNLAMEKMQDIVGRIAGGPLGQLADMMASLLENSWALYGVMTAIAAVSFTKLVTGLAASAVQAGLLAVESTVAASALTFGLAGIAIVGAIAMVAAAASAANEQVATPAGDMFSSKGKTMVSTKEGGLFSLSDKDDIAVAPGIGDMIRQPKQQTAVVQDNSALLNELKDLNKNTLITNQLVQQTNNKSGTIIMSGDRVGTALVKGNYNLA
jgi:hypothetical protein